MTPYIGILLVEGYSLTAAAGFIDVIRLAAGRGLSGERRHFDWKIVTLGNGLARSSSGACLAADRQQPNPEMFDHLVVFGPQPDGDYALAPDIRRYCERAARCGARISGIGGGVAVLLAAGLAGAHPVCVHWHHRDDYLMAFGEIPLDVESLYREDGRLATCAGGTAAADFALKLVRRHLGRRWERKCLGLLLMERAREPHHLQSIPAYERPVGCAVIRQTIRTIEQNFSEAIDIEALADAAALSRRQLERKFRCETGKGVHEFIRDMKLKAARARILQTDLTILEISVDCGFQTIEHFNFIYKKKFGQTPTQTRQKARQDACLDDAAA